jgi:polygalacturonase
LATLNVRDFGAKGDGQSLDTQAIQAAIDAAAREDGVVTFKPGIYLTGALFLKSGISFRVDQGVRLLGSKNLAHYPLVQTRVAGIEAKWPAALLNVYEQERVRILGDGVIDGDGKVFWDSYWALRRQYDPKGLRWAADYDCQRPRLIHFYEAKDVTLRGPQLTRSGFWTVHVCYSQDVRIADITIRNNEGGRGPSTDGIDIDSSRKVLVENADISCNDDAVCLKAGRDSDGLRVARPTEQVVIRHCIIRDAAAGVTFGSETSGGFHDIEVSSLKVFHPTPVGILFKSAHTRGGEISNIRIRQCFFQDVPTIFRINLNWNPTYSYAEIPKGLQDISALWRVLATPVPREKGLARISDVRVSDITAVGAKQAFEVAAFAEAPLRNFRFERLDWEAQSAGRIANAEDWSFVNAKILTLDGKPVALEASSNVTGL